MTKQEINTVLLTIRDIRRKPSFSEADMRKCKKLFKPLRVFVKADTTFEQGWSNGYFADNMKENSELARTFCNMQIRTRS